MFVHGMSKNFNLTGEVHSHGSRNPGRGQGKSELTPLLLGMENCTIRLTMVDVPQAVCSRETQFMSALYAGGEKQVDLLGGVAFVLRKRAMG